MSTARFTAAIADTATPVFLDPSPVLQESVASAELVARGQSARPVRHLVWIYDLAGTKVDVIA